MDGLSEEKHAKVNTATSSSFFMNHDFLCSVVIVSNADGTVEEEDEEEEGTSEDTDSADKEKTTDDGGNEDSEPDSRAAIGKYHQKRVKNESYQIHTEQVIRLTSKVTNFGR